MRVYVGFDDTDVVGAERGTGRFARMFEEKLPENVTLYGVIRQQLPVFEGIPYTSKNSAACLVLDSVEPDQLDEIIERGTAHIHELFIDGSDPGLCVVAPGDGECGDLMEFGRTACTRIVSQQEALEVAKPFHLSGHGGTNDGIIGATAGVGLTMSGWSGRFIEFNGLRDFDTVVTVAELESHGIKVLSVDRNAMVPGWEHQVHTADWLRPRLWGFGPTLPVTSCGNGRWEVVGKKNE